MDQPVCRRITPALQEDDWKVKKDGGQIDYMAGATITPRAVVKAVHKALHYFEENRDQLVRSRMQAIPERASRQEAGTK